MQDKRGSRGGMVVWDLLRTAKSRLHPQAVLPFAIFLVGYMLIPRLASEAQLTTLIYIGIYALLVIGLNLLMGYAGQVSLGHAAFFGIGAYTSAILAVRPIAREVIPGISIGVGIMTAAAVFLMLAGVSGWKLVSGIGLLIVLGFVRDWLDNTIALTILSAAVMTIFGFTTRSNWRKTCVAGIVLPSVTSLSDWFLAGTLSREGTSPWTGMMVGIFLTSVVAYLIGSQVLRLKGHYLAMATLAFGIIVEIVFRQWTAVTGGSSDGIFNIPTIMFFDYLPGFAKRCYELAVGRSVGLKAQYYYLVWAFVFIALVLAVNIVKSRVGRAFRAVHGSELAAASLGVDTVSYKVQIFVLSACMASVAGSLHAHNAGIGYIHPSEFGFLVSVELVVMVVLGGLASVWGSLFGAAAIQLLKDRLLDLEKATPELLGLKLQGLDPVVFGAILILIMIALPQGLVRGLADGIFVVLRTGHRGRGDMTGQ